MARWTSLARRPRVTGCSSSWQWQFIGVWTAAHPCRQCWHSAASAFHQPSTTCSTSLPARHVRASGLFSCRPHRLELSRPDSIWEWDPTIRADYFRRLLMIKRAGYTGFRPYSLRPVHVCVCLFVCFTQNLNSSISKAVIERRLRWRCATHY